MKLNDDDIPTILVITPVLNGVDYIDRCIGHVALQSGAFKIRYHVQDGGSTDGTTNHLERWKTRFDKGEIALFCEGIEFSYSSEPDGSMYAALDRAFQFVDPPTDWFMTWINHDDFLLPGACAVAANMHRQFTPKEMAWFTGTPNQCDYDGMIMAHDSGAHRIPTRAVAQGLADNTFFAVIQQEGTFFRCSLWDQVNPKEAIKGQKRAGDYNLWRLMAQHATCYRTYLMQLGRFSYRTGQLTDGWTEYQREIDDILPPTERFHRFVDLVTNTSLEAHSVRWHHADRRFVQETATLSSAEALQFAEYKFHNLSKSLLVNETQSNVHWPNTNSAFDERQILEKYRQLSSHEVKMLAENWAPVNPDWTRALIKWPFNAKKWRALKRFSRRMQR